MSENIENRVARLSDDFYHALRNLPVRLQKVLRLRYRGHSFGEIGEELGISIGLAHQLFNDGINQLKSVIAVDCSDKGIQITIAWDPEMISADQYARLVTAMGDLVRAEGGIGIERVRSQEIGIGVPCDSGVPR